MGSPELTQARLKEVLDYDHSTGIFRWRIQTSVVKPGDIAGCAWKGGYRRIRVNNQIIAAHRLAWFYVHGYWPPEGIDHINGDTSDNRINNLRLADCKINGRNKKINSANQSGHTGIRWRQDSNKWECRIKVDYKDIYLGLFKDIDEAVSARRSANKKYGFHENHGIDRANELRRRVDGGVE